MGSSLFCPRLEEWEVPDARQLTLKDAHCQSERATGEHRWYLSVDSGGRGFVAFEDLATWVSARA